MTTIRGALASAALAAGMLTAIAAPPARAQVKLEHKFPEGQKLTYSSGLKIHRMLTVAGMEYPVDVDQVVTITRSIGRRAADQTLSIAEKIETFRSELTLPGNIRIAFDSKDGKLETDEKDLEYLGEIFRFLPGIEYTVVLDARNGVKAIEGAEKLQEKAEKLDARVRDAMKARLSAEKLRTRFDQELQILPDVLARPGEPWERTGLTEVVDMELEFRRKYEYVGTVKKGDRELDKIIVHATGATYRDDPNAQAPLKVTKAELKVESSEGTILFDRMAGRVVSDREKVRIKGTLTLSAQGQEFPGELDATIETDQELQAPPR